MEELSKKYKSVKLILSLELGYTISRKLTNNYRQGMKLIIENGERKIKLLGWGSAVIDPMIPFCHMFSNPDEWDVDLHFRSAEDIKIPVV
jgi:hypothetical protein